MNNYWNAFQGLLETIDYSSEEKVRLALRWYSYLTGKPQATYPCEFVNLENDVSSLLLMLQKKYQEKGLPVLLEGLRCMLMPKKFSAEDLNRFLRENNIGYAYESDGPYSTQGSFVELKPGKQDRREPAQYSKVFISHSSVDVEYAEALVEFLELIGVPGDCIFCSSIPEYGIPLDEDIYEYIKKQFTEEKVYVLFVLSDSYYKSAACLNEMGAAWVLQAAYTSFLLPGFEFTEMRGAVKANKISIKTDDKEDEVHTLLIQLRNKLQAGFGLESVNEAKWSRRIKLIEERLRKPRG